MKIQKNLEKQASTAADLFNKLDILEIRQEAGDLLCVTYYLALAFTFSLLSLSIFLFALPIQTTVDQKNIQLLSAIENYSQVNGTQTLLGFQISANHFPLDQFPRSTRNNKLSSVTSLFVESLSQSKSLTLYSESMGPYITSYFELQQKKPKQNKKTAKSAKTDQITMREILSQVKLTKKNHNAEEIDIAKHCLSLQYKHQSRKNVQPLDNQPSCLQADGIPGVQLSFFKLKKLPFDVPACNSVNDCKAYCEQINAVYLEKINQNPLSPTCYAPFVMQTACAVLQKAGSKKLSLKEGCFNGQFGHYNRIGLDESISFEGYSVQLRDESDPWITAVNISGDPEKPYQVQLSFFDNFRNYLLITALILSIVTVLAGTPLLFKTKLQDQPTLDQQPSNLKNNFMMNTNSFHKQQDEVEWMENEISVVKY